MTDADVLIGRIEVIRAQNNLNWMNILRIAMAADPERTKRILANIEQCDEGVRNLTRELAR